MDVIVLLIIIVFLLAGIFSRAKRGPGGPGVKPCPYCYTPMHRKAVICTSCGLESKWRPRTMWDPPLPQK